MADRIIDLNALQPNAIYADVADINPSLTGTPEADWDPAHFGRVQIWNNVALDRGQILNVGMEWITGFTQNILSTQTAIRGLKLAMSLPSNNPTNNNSLFAQQVRLPEATEDMLAAVNIPATNHFSETPFSLTARQVQRGPQPPLENVEAIPAGGLQEPEQQGPADTDLQRCTSYCFIAAYLMKLLVKSPENVVGGLENMRLRYESFYGPSRVVSGFTIVYAQATAYREALASQSHIAATYIHSIAFTHQTIVGDLSQREVGILSYLGFMPFSYSGMHAYTLMMELKEFSHMQLNKLLTLFHSDITAPALRKIAAIVRNFERTVDAPNRDITFRYCTIWGAHYFASVRSRNATHLLYTVACAWKTLAAGNPNADPERIAATARLSDQMKRTLKRAGEIIGETLKQNMLGGVDASPAFAMAIANPGQVHAADNEGWDQM
ncbi:TPA_asm: N [Cypripedium gammacytorhabdovirus 1]|nr:TPA_asm: N [Cypripedium gammacytorhabdovirus 1]